MFRLQKTYHIYFYMFSNDDVFVYLYEIKKAELSLWAEVLAYLQVPRVDPGSLVVACCIAGELEDLRRQVLQNSSEVDRCTTADVLCVMSFLDEAVDTTDRKLETSTL